MGYMFIINRSGELTTCWSPFRDGRTSPINVPLILLIYVLAAASWAWFEKPILG